MSENSGHEHRPGLVGRLVAALHHEVKADNLEAFRRAGGVAYPELEQAEQLRADLVAKGLAPRAFPPAQAAQLLCAWNAFILQTLGEQLLDADYAADPRTVGYVPPVTAQQVAAVFNQVEPWVARARQAAANPAYRVDADIEVPAELPGWVEADPCPLAHLRGMVAACGTVRVHAEAAVADFTRAAGDDPAHARDLNRLRQLLAEATTAADYADGLLAKHPDQQLHEAIEQRLHHALEAYYLLGQIAAMPALLDLYPTPAQPAPGPFDPTTIDPWSLTDPHYRDKWRRDPRARQAISTLWAMDPNPAATVHIQAEIDAALRGGFIEYATYPGGNLIGHYYCCPWSAVYFVKRRVVIGGTRLRPMQQFVFDVSAEEMGEGKPFVRRIKVAVFQPTTKVDYCDPNADHDDD